MWKYSAPLVLQQCSQTRISALPSGLHDVLFRLTWMGAQPKAKQMQDVSFVASAKRISHDATVPMDSMLRFSDTKYKRAKAAHSQTHFYSLEMQPLNGPGMQCRSWCQSQSHVYPTPNASKRDCENQIHHPTQYCTICSSIKPCMCTEETLIHVEISG